MTVNTTASQKISRDFDISRCPELQTRLDYWFQRFDGMMQKIRLGFAEFKEAYHCDTVGLGAAVRLFGSTKCVYNVTDSEISVFINPLELIDLQKIPSQFHITDIEDPRLNDDEFLAEFVSWLSSYLKMDGLSLQNLSSAEKKEIICLLRLTRNPQMFEKAIEAGIYHELAHIFFKHPLNQPYELTYQATLKLLGSIFLTGMMLTYFARKNYSFLRRALITLLGTGGAALASACLTIRAWNISQKQEFEADEKACNAFQDTSGSIYYFDTKNKHLDIELKKWKTNFKGSEFMKKIGEIILPFLLRYPPTHPSDKARAENLQKLTF